MQIDALSDAEALESHLKTETHIRQSLKRPRTQAQFDIPLKGNDSAEQKKAALCELSSSGQEADIDMEDAELSDPEIFSTTKYCGSAGFKLDDIGHKTTARKVDHQILT